MPAIKKCVVYRFTIGQKHYSQILVAHFGNPGPTANAAVLLNLFHFRKVDGPPYPFCPDYGTVRTAHAGFEVAGGFHPPVLDKWLQVRYG